MLYSVTGLTVGLMKVLCLHKQRFMTSRQNWRIIGWLEAIKMYSPHPLLGVFKLTIEQAECQSTKLLQLYSAFCDHPLQILCFAAQTEVTVSPFHLKNQRCVRNILFSASVLAETRCCKCFCSYRQNTSLDGWRSLVITCCRPVMCLHALPQSLVKRI
jgi:hypothetical protein